MKMVSVVGIWTVLVLFVVMVPQESWGNRQSHSNCLASSCGKISNISHPFRRKDDPPNCGDTRYEIECLNDDVAVLRLSPEREAEYHVQSINYSNYTIRLVDPNIQEDNLSSIPRYFLYKFNFSDAIDYWRGAPLPSNWDVDLYHATQMHDRRGFGVPLFYHIMYMSCNSAVRKEEDTNTCSSCLDSHTYFVAGDLSVTGLRWKQGCRVKLIAATSGLFQKQQQQYIGWYRDSYFIQVPNVPYSDVHRALVYGFELSWLPATCEDHCGSKPCYFNQTSHKVICYSICDFSSYSTDGCGIWERIRIYTIVPLSDFKRIVDDFLYGMYTLLRLRGEDKVFDYHWEYSFGPRVVGWYTLLIYLPARVLSGLILLAVPLIYRWRRRHSSDYVNIENFLQDNDLAPIRYSYKEIKKMTKNFKVKLGQGGFGSVYKGKLRSGPHVAIKMLKQSKANGQDFINEVATIGRIHHVNVVRLIGFCVEGSKRALVYDFMPNGSLDKYIFSKEGSIPLSYEKIYEISLGIARGISYLHHGCDMQILHFDIKPHNILLDENFVPKVSDFGLAKLYPIDHSIVTLTDKRGTIGYIAPELFYNNLGGISYKADVYSFGMLLMEVAGRRKNLNPRAENSSQLFFPTWIYDQVSKGKEVELNDGTEEEKSIAKKMIITALWCIQLKPCDRPSMKRVVEMLDGGLEDLLMPPKPRLYPDETLKTEEVTSDLSTSTSGDLSEATLISDNTIVEN